MAILSSILGTWNGGGSGGGGTGPQPGDTMFVTNNSQTAFAQGVLTLFNGSILVDTLNTGYALVSIDSTTPSIKGAGGSDLDAVYPATWYTDGSDDTVYGINLDATVTAVLDQNVYSNIAVTGNATLLNQTAQFTIVNNVIVSINLS